MLLMVKVISRNEESNNLFNLETNTNSANPALTSANLYLNGFTINQDGVIDIPNVGKIYVLNQTLEEAEQTILAKAKDYLINPFVVVKLANFEITILGEVNIPGRYPVYKQGLTIYDALAMAGDINEYGNLTEIKLIRSNKNKKQINGSQIFNEISLRIQNHKSENINVVVEQVSAMPGQGVTSMFNFGQSFGVLKGVCAAMQLPIFFVRPAKWKKHFDLINSQKDSSRVKAIEMFPKFSSMLSRKKDTNKADAILIASFYYETYKIEE